MASLFGPFMFLLIFITSSSWAAAEIDPKLLDELDSNPEGGVRVIVEFKPLPPNPPAESVASTLAQDPAFLVKKSVKESADSQAEVMKFVSSKMKGRQASNGENETPRNFWASNMLYIPKADKALIDSLSSNDERNANISKIRLPYDGAFLSRPYNQYVTPGVLNTTNVTNWGLKMIEVDKWHDKNFSGEGIIIGHIDSGVDVMHPDIKDSWIGPPFGWLDPEYNTTFPWELDMDANHGTHTLGIAVGKKTGVAPGARWISCKLANGTKPLEINFQECGEFMLCPGGIDRNPTCKFRPHVVTNSWGLFPNMPQEAFDIYVTWWRQNRIFPVWAVPNSGTAGCGSLEAPDDHPMVFSVGMTLPNDSLSNKSGKGPITRQASANFNLGPLTDPIKPNLVAPGEDVISLAMDGKYRPMSGTSMACPHVAGAAALFLSYKKLLDFDHVKDHLQFNAVKRGLTTQDPQERCGGKTDNLIPNFKFGHGRLHLPEPKDISPDPDRPTDTYPAPNYTGFQEEMNKFKDQINHSRAIFLIPPSQSSPASLKGNVLLMMGFIGGLLLTVINHQ